MADDPVKPDTPVTLEIYHVSLQYDSPMEGTVPIAAENIEDARKKILDLFARRENVKIVDIYPASAINLPKETEETPEDETPQAPPTVN